MKVEIHFYQNSKGRRGKGKKTHTGSKVGFPWFSKSEIIETNWSRDGLRFKSEKLEEGLQAARSRLSARAGWEPMACRRSSSRRERGAACSGWDSRTWCVLGLWNEGPSRDWVWWRLDCEGVGRPRRKKGEWGEGPSLAITAMFCFEFAYVFRLSVSMRKVAGEQPICVFI